VAAGEEDEMARARLQFLDEGDKQALHEQTMRVLAEAGVAFNVPEVLDLLADAGARVDHERMVAHLPEDLVWDALEHVPREVLLAARDPERDVIVGGGHPLSVCSDGTATYLLDDETGERLPGSAERLHQVMRLLDALPQCDYVWPSLSARDLDPATANLEIEYISLTECSKHLQDEVRGPEFVAPLVDMLEAIAGASLKERPIFSVINCTVAPLQHDAEMTKATLGLARAGVPIVAMPMPLMAATAPASPMGNCVVSMAEILSTVVMLQLAVPGCALIAGPEPGAADLRSGRYLCGPPEADLAKIASIEMCRYYGLPSQMEGLGGDALYPDLQEGAEGTVTALLGALVGADTMLGFGTLDGADCFSLADAVLDDDLMAGLRRYLGATSTDAAATLVDDIIAVGPGGHYLTRRSTREAARSGVLWEPRVLRRGRQSQDPRALVREAAERAADILAHHRATPLDEDVVRYVEDVVASYRATVHDRHHLSKVRNA
jgi:trimethylamine---corrinoid protein Co-methyltransferase